MIIRNSLCSGSSISWDQSNITLKSLLGLEFLESKKLEITQFKDVNEEILEAVKADLRQNYQFTLFSIIPGLAGEVSTIKKISKKMGITEEDIAVFSFRLLRAGLWKIKDEKIVTDFEFLNLGDISVKDYLAMTVSIVSHLSDSQSYAYDSLSLVTNRGLIRNFVGKVNQALGEFNEKSNAPGIEKDCIFSWTHTGVIEIEHKKKPSAKDLEE